MVYEKRTQLIEVLGDLDEEIITTFLDCDADHLKVPVAALKKSLRKLTISGKCVPTFCGAAFRNIGVQPLMDGIIDYLPSPDDVPLPTGINKDSNNLCALAFKVIDHDKRGPLVFLRVYSGRLERHLESVCKCMLMNMRRFRRLLLVI